MKNLLSAFIFSLLALQAQAQTEDRTLTSSFSIPAEELDGRLFGKIKEERIAFMIDTSGSFKDYQSKVMGSLANTIQNLKPDQSFTIVILADKNLYFNKGEVVNASDENKAAAIEFLKYQPNHVYYEPITSGLKQLKKKNDRLDRVYFFGDGDYTPEKQSKVGEYFAADGLRADINRVSDLYKAVQKLGAPITARTGRDREWSEENQFESTSMLKTMVDVSHGTIIWESLK